MPAPPLVLVCATLGRAAPPLATLPHVADLVSNLLDASLALSLARAASSGSIPLLQRVATRLLDDACVDRITRADAFAQALETAIRANDLAMAAALHALHPQPLDARSLKLAMAHGSLALVQWVVEHRHDRVCCEPGLASLCRGCAELAARLIGDKDPFAIVSWLIDAGVLFVSDGADTTTCSTSARTAMLKSVELVRWCDARGLLSNPMIGRLMRDTMHEHNQQSEAIVRYFLERGFAPSQGHEEAFVDTLIAASCHSGQEALVQLVLASKVFDKLRHHFVYAPIREGGAHVLQWDDAYKVTRGFMFMATVVSVVGKAGHLPTMQWLAEARNTTMLAPQGDHANEQELLTTLRWLHSNGIGRWSGELMNSAAATGHLRVIQWLHENRPEPCSTRTMDGAAANGHLEVVQWLHGNRVEGCTERAMNAAAGGGHLAVVTWLLGNRTEGNVSMAAAFAAANGQLDMMRWCLDHGGCARCIRARLLQEPLTYKIAQFASFDIRVLSSLTWLDGHASSAGTADCRGQCIPSFPQNTLVNLAAAALGQGDMLLLSYLHEHHHELFAWPAHVHGELMNAITWQGHLPAVQWLHTRYPNNLDWLLLAEDASRRDQIEIAEWLRTVARTE